MLQLNHVTHTNTVSSPGGFFLFFFF
jgi:hypothetical protein